MIDALSLLLKCYTADICAQRAGMMGSYRHHAGYHFHNMGNTYCLYIYIYIYIYIFYWLYCGTKVR